MATTTDNGELTDHPDLADLESRLDSKYSRDFAAKADSRQAVADDESGIDKPPTIPSGQGANPEPGGKKSFLGRLVAGSKGYAPTGGLIGLILGAFGITSAVLSPMSLLVNFADTLSNHSSLGDHLFVKAGNSYIASILKGDGRDCATSKIKCKFTTISEDRKAEWEKRGIKVNVDPEKTVLGRYKVRGLEFKGTEVKTLSQYKNLRYTNAEFNSLLKRFPVRAYLLEKGPFRTGTLAKFGLNLAEKFKSSTNDDKQKRTEENNKSMNDKTKAPVDDNGKSVPEKVKSQAEEKTSKAVTPQAEKLKSLKTAFKVSAGLSMATTGACLAYDTVRATQSAITLYWHQDLIEFGLPFLEAGSQAKENGVNGGFDWQTAEYFGDRLTTPITQKDVDESDGLYSSDMIGKTAMDSKGMDAVLGGSYADVNSGYASKYNGWAPSVWGIGIVKELQGLVGKDNIRTVCTSAKAVTEAASILTCGAKLPQCLATLAAYEAVTNLWGEDILKYITDQLEEPAYEAIAAANLTSSLVGPPLGQALVSASGVMTSYMDRASGFPIAGDDTQVKNAYNDMYTDEDYTKNEIADAKEEASKNQLDPNNQYSFIGQLASKFSGVRWNGTLLSSIANMTKIATDSPSLLSSAYAEQQGLYQPIEVYNSDKQIQGTLDNCTDFGTKEIGIPCFGQSGRTVPTVMPNVEDCLNQEENGGELCINQAIDYLSSHRYGDDTKPYIDANTGEPSDMNEYSKAGDKDYDNPFLMFMSYCGRDRAYPIGYTDKSAEDGEDKDDWHTGKSCAASSNTQAAEVCQSSSCAATPSGTSERDTTLGWMSYYYTQCIAMMASEEGKDYCWNDDTTSTSGGDTVATGECTSLAQQLLDSPNVQFQQASEREYMERAAKDCTEILNQCGNHSVQMSTKLLGLMVAASQKYKITIGAQASGHECDSGYHPLGQAFDITGVRPLDQPQQTMIAPGSPSVYPQADQAIIKQFDEYLDQTAANGGFTLEIGQQQCFGSTGAPSVRSGTLVNDVCNHVHVGVREH